MKVFYELQPDIFAKYVPKIAKELRDDISFKAGATIQEILPLPLIFTTRHSAQEPPKGMHGRVIPVMSDEFITALQQAGVSNLQCFPAELKSSVDGTVWKNYQAVNVIGSIACADLNSSEFTSIMDRPGEGSLSLMAFEDLKIDPVRAKGALLFRLAESPGTIIIAGSVVECLRTVQSDDDWGITLDKR